MVLIIILQLANKTCYEIIVIFDHSALFAVSRGIPFYLVHSSLGFKFYFSAEMKLFKDLKIKKTKISSIISRKSSDDNSFKIKYSRGNKDTSPFDISPM